MPNQPHAWAVNTGGAGIILAPWPAVASVPSAPPSSISGGVGGSCLVGGGAEILRGGGADVGIIYGGGSRLLGPYGQGELGGLGLSFVIRDSVVVFSGDASLNYVFAAGGGAADWQGISTSDPKVGPFCIPLRPGVTYRVQLSARTDSIGGTPKYRLTFLHDKPGTLSSQKTLTFAAANAWQTDQFIFAVPANAGPNSFLMIEFQRGATALQNFWVDSIRMDELGQRFRCLLNRSTSLTLTTGVTTQVGWDTDIYDIGELHDTVTNNSRITIPKGGDAGQWTFIASAQFAANATGMRIVQILKNGVVIAETKVAPNPTAAQETTIQCIAVDNDPATGAFYEMFVQQNSGGNLNLNSSLASGGPFFQATHAW